LPHHWPAARRIHASCQVYRFRIVSVPSRAEQHSASVSKPRKPFCDVRTEHLAKNSVITVDDSEQKCDVRNRPDWNCQISADMLHSPDPRKFVKYSHLVHYIRVARRKWRVVKHCIILTVREMADRDPKEAAAAAAFLL
jgi:hypothetical protein